MEERKNPEINGGSVGESVGLPLPSRVMHELSERRRWLGIFKVSTDSSGDSESPFCHRQVGNPIDQTAE